MDERIADDMAADCEETETNAGAARTWPLAERPGFLARRLHQIHVSLFSERCASFRITPLQYSLLSLLRDLDEADQTTLANAVALDRTTTTGALKRLATRGLVSRSTSLADRRAQICRITAEGRALHAAMEHAAHEAHALTISALGAQDQDVLVGLLRRVVAGHDHRRGHLDLG
ncbi:MarR family winged helix-turn-helix transcriptional regulator [Methylobacterium sp. E-025]|uniref:MarR family winged helix-turn-helix transcriptional regulator n=1 Tax=Methylobacterium sp. E-025 TaxID=2836561 RepID=UPI001FBB6401|nr:MarR family winged helix-turn-helix transcriptional regulator [Methylobacterium sp. E-025]MCJ2113441.1 MarR family winged helix-turn-helix transcriptional regulator [Methylobacterium sp. E-025]